MLNRLSVRWILTIIAVILNALGVAFITTAMLGTVPATSIPNVLSIVYDRFHLAAICLSSASSRSCSSMCS